MNDEGKQPSRQQKHVAIHNEGMNLERAVDRLQGFIYEINGNDEPTVTSAQEAVRDMLLVEVIDWAPGFMAEQADRIDRLVFELRELLF